jgi:hypothetical protein
MLVLSLNLRGTGGTLKVASFCRFLEHVHPYIILRQETLVNEQRARYFIHLFRLSWVSSSVSSVGTSRGLLAAWDPLLFYFDSYVTVGGMSLNIYGPCKDRKQFWKALEESDILAIKNSIVAGEFKYYTFN